MFSSQSHRKTSPRREDALKESQKGIRQQPKDDLPSGSAVLSPHRLAWIDYAKGIAILLVVLCHTVNGLILAGILPRQMPAWSFLNNYFYTFQVPVFFFVSGLFAERSLEKYGAAIFLRQKVLTLLYPYFIWQTGQILLMMAMEGWANHLTNLRQLLLTPVMPYMQYWFLYVLFLVYLLFTGLVWVGVRRTWIPMLALLFYALSWVEVPWQWPPYIFTLRHFLYFALGMLLSGALVRTNWMDRFNRITRICVSAALLAGTAILVSQGLGYTSPWRLWGACTGIAGVIALASALEDIPGLGFLSHLGKRSLEIYVVHVICIAGMRGVLMFLLGVRTPAVHILLGVTPGILSGLLAVYCCRRLGVDLFRAPMFPDYRRTADRE